MNYATIKENDIADGLGIRVALYVSGCRNFCKNCHNQKAWQFDYGNEFTIVERMKILSLLRQPQIRGFSILGGEPLDKNNAKEVNSLIDEVRADWKKLGLKKDIWLYTGYSTIPPTVNDAEDFFNVKNETFDKETFKEIEMKVDVIVDGPYIDEQRDPSLCFRGSRNQNIIVYRVVDPTIKHIDKFIVNNLVESENDIPDKIQELIGF